MKQEYEKPELIVYDDISDLTAGIGTSEGGA